MSISTGSTEPRGGDASVDGDDSIARGGDAGDAVHEDGGRGGDASVFGDRSVAIGGRGGRGGIGRGGPGGKAHAEGDDLEVYGGEGGEAAQYDGRGGRGGRTAKIDKLAAWGVEVRPAHMRWPYGEPVIEPGRGGDSPDTPQYKARRVIVEDIKARYFAERGLPLDEVWWDRELVPLSWIAAELMADGHRWTLAVVEDEYEFSDLPIGPG